MPDVTIYHNPRCSKSRQTLALLREQGIEPRVVEYLKSPPSVDELNKLLVQLGGEPSELVRPKECRELGLPATGEAAEVVARIAEHPQIMQRPVVVVGEQARIGRPAEAVLDILSKAATSGQAIPGSSSARDFLTTVPPADPGALAPSRKRRPSGASFPG